MWIGFWNDAGDTGLQLKSLSVCFVRSIVYLVSIYFIVLLCYIHTYLREGIRQVVWDSQEENQALESEQIPRDRGDITFGE